MDRKLGKRPRKFDARSPRLAMLAASNPLPPAPSSIELVAADWTALGNDQVGDCTVASLLHLVQSWSAANGAIVQPSTDAALAVYSAITGYDPARPESDQGAVELDVLQFWMRTAVAIDDFAAADQLDGYASIDLGDAGLVQRAISAFGGVYAGLAMPLAAQEQEVWDAPGILVGDYGYGSWGGHAVPLLGYDSIGPICISWGRVQRMTWNFWSCYSDEAYAPLSLDWVQGPRSPRGMVWRSLVSDIHAMCGSMRWAP